MVMGNKKRATAVMSIIRTTDIVNRCLDIELRKWGSSPPRFSVMNALVVHGGTMHPSDISKWIFRAKHSVTSMLKVLERIGYVERKPNEMDGRSVDISITQKGWNATNTMMPIAEDMGKKIMSCLDENEIDSLLEILKKIRRYLLIELSAPGITPINANRSKDPR